jgi:hypothetical protein
MRDLPSMSERRPLGNVRELGPFAADLPEVEGGSFGQLSTARIVSYACASMVVMCILCSRLALPLGAKQIPLTLPVAVVHIALIVVLSRGSLALPRLFATLGVLGLILFEMSLVHRHSSMFSLVYVALIYMTLTATTKIDEPALRRIWRTFIGLACVGAILGALQIAVQTVAGGYYLDPVQDLPDQLQLQGYSITYPIMRGVLPTLKANGMLFVEPSAFSQFLALALLGELWLYRRLKVMALLCLGLVLSFSGTGLMMVAAGIAFGARPRAMLALAVVGAVVAGILFATGYGEAFTSRVGEIRRPGTSGYERFVAPFAAMSLPFEDSVEAVLWGYGAGRVEDLDTEYAANYSPVPKVFLEYGLVGFFAFALLWATMFRRLALQRPIVGAMFVMYFLAAGSLLQPYTVFSLWALSAGFLKQPREVEEDDVVWIDAEPEPPPA